MIVIQIIGTIILVALLVVCIFMITALVISNFTKAPFLPSFGKARKKMIEFADIKEGDVVYDLGSGDGRLVITAAKAGAKAVGFETNPFLSFFAKLSAKLQKARTAEFLTTNYLNADLSKCNKLFLYLLPKAMEELEPKILEEMKSGSIIISNTFRFKNLKPIESFENPRIFMYKIEK